MHNILFLQIILILSSGIILFRANKILKATKHLVHQIKKYRSPKIILTIISNNSKIKGEIMSFKLLNKNATVLIKPVDADENEQPYQSGSEKYSSSNEAVFTVAKDETNPKQATITRVGAGLAQLTITVDPNPADEITEILSKSVDIEVPAPEDTDIVVTIDGNPVE